MSRYALVIAGCLSGERGDAGIAALVGDLSRAIGPSITLRARTGGRPVGASLPDALSELRERGTGRVLVATTHVTDGRLQREAAAAVRAAAPGFKDIRLASPLLARESDLIAVARALDAALPAEPGRVVALAGHRGPECEAAFSRLSAALRSLGREDVLVDAPERLEARLRNRVGSWILLGPFLAALGHHARHDVLVCLRAQLESSGFSVATWPHSLAELPAVRGLVVAHALAASPISVG